eukprot:3030108-Pyramimonas_sp.AAC.1
MGGVPTGVASFRGYPAKGSHLADGALGELEGAEAQEGDGVEGDVHVEVRVGEGNQAVHAVRERRHLGLGDVAEVLAHDLLDGLKGEGHDRALAVGGGGGEHHEHRLPPGLDVRHARQHHLRHAPDDELADLHGGALAHHHHEGLEEVVLEGVARQLVPLQELHRQLAEAVDGVHGDLQVGVAADGDE